MEDPLPVSGPSRSKRHDQPQLADKIIALQRKNAAAAGPSRVSSRRTEKVDEFARGGERAPPNRTLFDPSRPIPPLTSTQAAQAGQATEDRRCRPPPPIPPPQPGTHRGDLPSPLPVKKLFNPDLHDPHHFHPRSTAPPSEASSGPSKAILLRSAGVNGRLTEEKADRERERRRRREGSERGSIKKKDSSDSKSKGSRSSEGSESFKDRDRGKGKGDTGIKVILKDIHNKIRVIEADLTELHKKMSADPEADISAILDRPIDPYSRRKDGGGDGDDAAAWMDLIGKHKDLADLHHLFLVRVFDPLVPSTFQQLAVKYNIPSRLWQVSFHLILERLRHAWMTAHPATLDLLTDLVYDAYNFYTDLLEDQALVNFRTAWIEALGDLARYRMAIASHVNETNQPGTVDTGADLVEDGDEPVSSGASIGAEVAQNWDVEDKETWRTTARDWYTMGITEKPGEGRLHHHLALLCRDVRGQEGRALHHFTKSLIVTHQYTTSRESLLPLFDSPLQSQRSLPEATAMDLFVRLHGMLFTKIDLDHFSAVMSRFMERLEEDARLDGVSRKANVTQVDWIVMASVNIAAVLQYGSTSGFVRKGLAMEGVERRKAHASNGDDGDGDDGENGEVEPPWLPIEDDVPAQMEAMAENTPTFTYALHLASAILKFTFDHPTRQQGLHAVLNPYIPLLLTFLATVLRQQHVVNILANHIPWTSLLSFLNDSDLEIREESRLMAGPPLPEDWAVRGMEWVGRRVYERGFWKAKGSGRGSGAMTQPQPRSGERFQSEMDVLLANFESVLDISEGVVDEAEGTDLTDGPAAVDQRRWKRVTWAAGTLVKQVDGLETGDAKVSIEGSLKARMEEMERVRKAEEEKLEKAERAKRERERFEEEEEVAELARSDSEDDDPASAALRERRKHLRSIVSSPSKHGPSRKTVKKTSLHVVPGYTMLVFDTNVLLSSLNVFQSIVEGGQWSVIIPLPVVTELDGLSKNSSPLGISAVKAITYLESRIRTHSLCLKIQTSRGNYLSDLLIRTENVDFSDPALASRNMDDLILNIASFQSEHFVDRSTILGQPSSGVGATKVLLVTFDRNLRLRARARGIDAADEREFNAILGNG